MLTRLNGFFQFVDLFHSHVLLGIFLKRVHTQRATQGDHAVFDIDMAKPAALLD